MKARNLLSTYDTSSSCILGSDSLTIVYCNLLDDTRTRSLGVLHFAICNLARARFAVTGRSALFELLNSNTNSFVNFHL